MVVVCTRCAVLFESTVVFVDRIVISWFGCVESTALFSSSLLPTTTV